MIISPNPVVELKKENGKKITVGTYGSDVTFVVWRKNDSVLLPLVLNRMEAQRLKAELDKALVAADHAGTAAGSFLRTERSK